MIFLFATFQEVIILSKELVTKSVEELAPLLKNREISSLELTQAVMDHAEKLDKEINAFIMMTRGRAEKAARVADEEIKAGYYRGMYHGIPMAVKDNLYFKGEVTTMGSKINQNFIPHYEATVIQKLRHAGVIFTGKLSMHEYAAGVTNNNPHCGPCHNPWNTKMVPGGSSGGSGAAVAADMTVASLGTDTAGSVRIPASACGIVGLKPTYGRVSKYGCFPLSWSLDHIGPMTKTVKDAAGLLEIMEGYDPLDSTSLNVPTTGNYIERLTGDIEGLVIGVSEDYFFHHIDKEVETFVRKALQMLEDRGAKVEVVSIPSLQYAEYAELVTIISEAATIHHRNLTKRADDYGDDVRLFFELGELPSAVDFLEAQQLRRQIKKDFEQAFEKVDVIIAPTLPILPPEIGANKTTLNGKEVDVLDEMIRLTGPSNLTGLPSLSIPCGVAKDNLPVGMQVIGPALREDLVLNVGYAYELTNPMEGKRPNLLTEVE